MKKGPTKTLDHSKRRGLKRAAIFGALSLALHAAPGAKAAHQFLAPEVRETTSMIARDLRRSYRSIFENDETAKAASFKGMAGELLSEEEYEERRKAAEDLIIFQPKQAKDLVLQGKIPLDKIFIDHGRFFLETEYQRGVTREETEERMAAWEKLKEEIESEVTLFNSTDDEIALMTKYMGRYGQNNTWTSDYMGDLLISEKHEGNCSARTKLILTILNDIKWYHLTDIKIVHMAIHSEVLFEMDHKAWYVASNFPYRIPEADISETALIDRKVFVKTHLGIQSDVIVLDENRNPKRSLRSEEIIAGLLVYGGMPLLLAKNYVGLRSPYNRMGPRVKKKPDPITDAIEVEMLDNNHHSESGNEGKDKETNKDRKKKKMNYQMTAEERIAARLSGEFMFEGDDNRDLENLDQLKGIELTSFNLTRSSLADISELENQKRLKKVAIEMAPVAELSPLSNLPIEELSLTYTRVSSLDSLRGLQLTSFKFHHDSITIDLSPLKGMPIEELALTDCTVRNLEAIEDAPVRILELHGAHFTDLEPFAKMPLEEVDISGTGIKDLSVLAGKKLRKIKLNTAARDLSPIREFLLAARERQDVRIERLIDIPGCFEINWETMKLEKYEDDYDCKYPISVRGHN